MIRKNSCSVLSFFFGDDVEVELDATRIIYVLVGLTVCPTFSPTDRADQGAIFGKIQHKTLEEWCMTTSERGQVCSEGLPLGQLPN